MQWFFEGGMQVIDFQQFPELRVHSAVHPNSSKTLIICNLLGTIYGRTQWIRTPSRSMPRNQVI